MLIKVLAVCLALATFQVKADIRYCGEPARDRYGKIIRSAAVIAEFQRLSNQPCAADGLWRVRYYRKYDMDAQES